MIPCHDSRGEKWQVQRIPFWDPFTNSCRWFCDPSGRRKKLLPPKTQQLFLEKDFVVFQFTNLSSEQEEDLFARVQMGVQLSAAEKMRAKSGPWQELTKLFVQDFDVVYSLLKDRQRAKDFQLTLACFSQITETKQQSNANGIPIFKAQNSAITKLLSDTAPIDDATKSHLANIWKTFQDLIQMDPNIFTNASKYLSGVQTFAPIEMVAVTVLISEHSKTRNNELLLGDIRALREALREHFQDLRNNPTVWKFIWEYIEDLEAIRGAVDRSTVNPNMQQQPTAPSQPVVVQPTVQRKQSLPKSKQIPILPPVRKTERETQLPTPPLPSRKRQRTDNVQADNHVPVCGPPRTDSIISPYLTNESNGLREAVYTAAASSSPQVTTDTFPQCTLQQQSTNNSNSATSLRPNPALLPQLAAVPEHARTNSPTCTPSIPSWEARGPMLQATRKPAIVNPPADVGRQESSCAPYTPEYTPQSTPPHVQQSRVVKPNAFRAPTAPMQSSTRVVSMPEYVSTSNGGFSDATTTCGPSTATQSRSKSSRTPLRLQGLGAFAPSHQNEEWNGIIASVSPKMASQVLPQNPVVAPPVAAQPSITSPVPIKFKSRKRKSATLPVAKPTPAQLDGIIDLTSDGELEEQRQTLLQAFKNKPATAKQRTTSPLRINPKPSIIGYPHSEDESESTNNPYAKFKQNPRLGR